MCSFFYFMCFKRHFLWIITWIYLSIPVSVYSQSQGHFNPSLLSPIQKGDFLLMQSLNEEALNLYQSLITKGEGDGYAFRGLVRAYKKMDELDDAESWIKDYLAGNPESSPALYASGYIFYLKNNMQKAENLFKRALEFDPDNALALNNLGAVLFSQNLHAQAVKLVHKAIEVNPKETMFFSNLGSIYKKMGDPEQIVADYDFYLERGDLELIRGYGMAVTRRMRQSSFKFYNEGHLSKAILKWIEIEKIYKKIDHQKGLIPVYFSLGLLYEEKGDYPSSQKYFNQVLILNPLHIQAKKRLDDLQR
jgi:tetratricopeptide (TPR) repeat protein